MAGGDQNIVELFVWLNRRDRCERESIAGRGSGRVRIVLKMIVFRHDKPALDKAGDEPAALLFAQKSAQLQRHLMARRDCHGSGT
jgi:hypothetical protein